MKTCDICQTHCEDYETYCPNCGHRFKQEKQSDGSLYYDDEIPDEPIHTPKPKRKSWPLVTMLVVLGFIGLIYFGLDLFISMPSLGSKDYENYSTMVEKNPNLDVAGLDAIIDKMHTQIPESSNDYWIFESYSVDDDMLTSAYVNMSKTDDRAYEGDYDMTCHSYEENKWTIERAYRVSFDPIYQDEIIDNCKQFFEINNDAFKEDAKGKIEECFNRLDIEQEDTFYLSGEGYNLQIEMTKEKSYLCELYITALDEVLYYDDGSLIG